MSQEPAAASSREPERRYERRYPFEAILEIEWGSSTFTGRVQDISPGGMFFISSEPLWLGARFTAKLKTQPPIHVECTVRHIEPGRGIAATLVFPDAKSKSQFMDLIGSLESTK
jgi:hypothetical protein